MTQTPSLDALSEALGIVWTYTDGAGRPMEAPPETRRALVAALGFSANTEADAARQLAKYRERLRDRGTLAPFYRVDEGHAMALATPLPQDARVILEDGTELDPAAPIPRGLHQIVCACGSAPLIAAPPRLALPERGWGVMAPLYGLWDEGPCDAPPQKSAQGLGDFGLLGQAAETWGRLGAAFLGINPVHAGFWDDPTATSPYSPSDRGRLNIRHVALPQAYRPPRSGGAPDEDGWVDYDREVPAHAAALRALFREGRGAPDPAFAAWRTSEGPDLERFAEHEALREHFGGRWPTWPEVYQNPTHPAVRRFAAENSEAVTFHAWAQWQAHGQLTQAQARARSAGMPLGLYLDLAVGSRPDGAECWAHPERYARRVSLGAPPDPFAPQGQCWDLAPFDPFVLLAQGLRPFARLLRAQLRYAGLLRIDHILGFARAFWVPDGLPGAYVTMPRSALLAVARLEAARAGATLVGEDLGVIPDGLRTDLAESGILGCRVMMFETSHGEFTRGDQYPEAALATFSTHDLPTLAGWCAGRDLEWWERLGTIDAQTAQAERQKRKAQVGALKAAAGGTRAQDVHRWLAATPSRLVGVQAEDLLGCVEQANLPGTVHAHPNWKRRLPVPVSRLAEDRGVLETAQGMAVRGTRAKPHPERPKHRDG